MLGTALSQRQEPRTQLLLSPGTQCDYYKLDAQKHTDGLDELILRYPSVLPTSLLAQSMTASYPWMRFFSRKTSCTSQRSRQCKPPLEMPSHLETPPQAQYQTQAGAHLYIADKERRLLRIQLSYGHGSGNEVLRQAQCHRLCAEELAWAAHVPDLPMPDCTECRIKAA